MSLNLRAFYIMIIYIDNVPCKDIPIDIHDSEVGYKPYIIIPIKYLVYQKEIEYNRICFKVKERNEGLKRKRIVVVEERRKSESYKKSDDDTVDYKKRMSMTHKNELFSFSKILPEKNLIKIVHRNSTRLHGM